MTPQTIIDDDIRNFLAERGIRVDKISAYAEGVASQNFRATGATGIDWTVRCDLRRPLEQIVDDRLFSEEAARQSIRVPLGPWLDGAVKDIATTARPTIPGSTVAQLDASSLPPPDEIGRMLGLLHSARPPAVERRFFYDGLLDPSHALWSDFPKARQVHADNPKLVKLIDFALARLQRDADRLRRTTTLSTCMIHGDFNPPNILVSGPHLVLIDWEKACQGYPVADLVQALYYFSAFYRRHNRSFAAAFVNGYSTASYLARPILDIWLSCFPSFIFLRDTVSAATRRPGPGGALQFTMFQAYLNEDSAPRFQHFVDHEHELRQMALD